MIRLVHDDDVNLVRVNGGRKVVGSVGDMKDKEVKIEEIDSNSYFLSQGKTMTSLQKWGMTRRNTCLLRRRLMTCGKRIRHPIGS